MVRLTSLLILLLGVFHVPITIASIDFKKFDELLPRRTIETIKQITDKTARETKLLEQVKAAFNTQTNKLTSEQQISFNSIMKEVIAALGNTKISDVMQYAIFVSADHTINTLATKSHVIVKTQAVNKAKAATESDLSKSGISPLDDSGDSIYNFYIGTVRSLENDGNWSSGQEWAFTSRTTWNPDNQYLTNHFGNFKIVTQGDISFSEIGALDKTNDEAISPTGNPFTVGGGIVRANAQIELLPHANIGAVFGTGFTSVPSEEVSFTDLKTRHYYGLTFPAIYGKADGKSAHAYLMIGLARDKLWSWQETTTTIDPITSIASETTTSYNENKRWFVDARIDLPGVFESENVHFGARVFADIPHSGNGPSDVRISLLISVDLDTLWSI